MLRKLLLALVLGAAGASFSLFTNQTHAFAACAPAATPCGYFFNTTENSWCNVLPDMANQFTWDANTNCWGTSTLFGVNTVNNGANPAPAFISRMTNYLNMGTGNIGFITDSNRGAAFIIDAMLGIDYHNSDPVTGVADARAQLATWTSRVNALAVHNCTVSTQPTCPGFSSGINWGYQPPYFCNVAGGVSASGYDPFLNDGAQYVTVSTDCDIAWRSSIPEIVFYWNNGANSFRLGSQCGNVQDSLNPLVDAQPTGTITVSCVSAQQKAVMTFGDPDGGATASISTPIPTGGTATFSLTSSPQTILIPASDTNPYVSQVVTLRVNDGGVFAPAGSFRTFTANTQVPCVTSSCGSLSYTPNPLDPYMTNVSVTAPVVTSAPPPSPTISVNITPPAGATYSFSHIPQAATTAGTTTSTTFTGVGNPTGFGKTGIWNVSWTLFANGSSVQTCTGQIKVVYLPYLSVWGGDVMVGDSPLFDTTSNTSACDPTANTGAGAFSWSSLSPAYTGGGAQYAVQALAQVEGFASGLNSTNSGTLPTGLMFANAFTPANPTALNPTIGKFGGFYGDITGDCDFTGDLTSVAISGAAATSQITALPATLAAGTSVTIYATGNVYISRNIAYNTTGWTDNTQIPRFRLVVVGGNIYVDSSVTQLDGLYVAEPTSVAGGTIFTCATGNGTAVDPTAAGTTNYFNTCINKLTINGAFIAKQVRFGRTTRGSLGQSAGDSSPATNNSAEVFNFTPELWLPRDTNTPPSNYTAITGLPPVL